MYKYKQGILGGTFDHFHRGHKKFLDTAFRDSEFVTIGLSLPELIEHKDLARTIEPYSTREHTLNKYLSEQNYTARAAVIPIHTIYGTTLQENTIDVLFATEETRPTAEHINQERQKRGMGTLEIDMVPHVTGDDGKIISSKRIRLGEIDRNGNSYVKLFLQKDTYLLPDFLKKEFQKPAGIIVNSNEQLSHLAHNATQLIAVGDIVSATVKKELAAPYMSIVDFKTRRQPLDTVSIQSQKMMLVNPHGTINTGIAAIYAAAAKKMQEGDTQVLSIDGEEDLLALPMVLLSPLGSVVLYGLYDVGMIALEVTEKTKEYAKKLLLQFE